MNKIYLFVRGAIFVIASILVLVFKDYLVSEIQWLVGGVLLFYGLETLIAFFIDKKSIAKHGNDFFFGLVQLFLGIFIFIFIRDYTVICVIWAMWAIIKASFELEDFVISLIHHRFGLLALIESILEIVFAFLLILEPGEHHAATHVYLLFADLLTAGAIFPLLKYGLDKLREKRKK